MCVGCLTLEFKAQHSKFSYCIYDEMYVDQHVGPMHCDSCLLMTSERTYYSLCSSSATLATYVSCHAFPLMSFVVNLSQFSLQPFRLGVTPNDEAQLRAMVAAWRLRNPADRQVCLPWHLPGCLFRLNSADRRAHPAEIPP